jgi:putative ABC transport system substrate-binding protein
MRFDRRRALAAIGSTMLAASAPAVAQQSPKVAKVGWIVFSPRAEAGPRKAAKDGLREGLHERGWIEGTNLTLDIRAGDRADAERLARELAAGGVDVIFADGAMVSGIRRATKTVPVVFSMSGDPVEAQWVASLSRPGGNLTGLSSYQLELEAKRFEHLKAMRPGLARTAVLGNALHPGYRAQLDMARDAARQLGMTVHTAPLKGGDDFNAAFASIAAEKAQALNVLSDGLTNQYAEAIARFAASQRIASISSWRSFVEAGNLASYGPDEREFNHRAAAYVDRILRGARPGDLPVEFPTRVGLTINRRTAEALGYVPKELFARGDVI